MMNPQLSHPVRFSSDVITVDQLLLSYPNLAFNPNCEESLSLWKDVVKAATPKNHKKDMAFDQEAMKRLLADEFNKLVLLRSLLLRSMRELGSRCTKVALLKSVSEKMGNTKAFSLGGGRRPDTRRLILIYEAEADVTAKKRKSGTRRSYRPRKRTQSDGLEDLLESSFGLHPVMHGDSFQNLFDEDHRSPMEVALTSASSSSYDSFYSSSSSCGGEILRMDSLDEFFDEDDLTTSEEDFPLIEVEDFVY